ncbi:doublecortin domain-containing protein 2B isoform X2 [Danio rerio]|uniref:Doublecortin domain-containing 2B n=3 Tax=Danio rerio TaxID=7955 RepID=A0A8M6Z9L0_DANRE|nr:doublecortin domain-containing protein 2B [Danio rerio]XP_017214252.1 doublecortin domain-containing protein 2B isoform X2 [Danio rerio]XP_017214253.1 doublecortin domain-containing protein 2B isoform X2 [Danio rerio]|eukprot:NP_001032778.2 doublecortin domain-containing protein 2B [Danio rerio]
MASTGVTSHLPPVKSVMVYRNGDPFFSGRRFVVNQRQIATMDALLNDITLNIGAPLAVRTLYTPRYGHRVADLGDLQQGAQYVAAGSERFKKLDYLSAGLKKAVEPTQSKTLARPNVSAKWRKVITLPCIIHVFRNGDILSPAMRLIIPRHMLKNLEQILSLISEKAMLRTGAVRRICTLEGFTVTSAEELETGQCYVAVGSERFKKLPYVEILLNKATGSSADRHYAGDRGLHRRIEDTHSDSTLLNSPEREGRRVKSTGDDAERESSPQPVKRRGRRAEREGENSVFYARPVRVRRQQPVHRPTPKVITEPSVFKASESTMREEVRGAEEVTEDENTAVELPVDQREAEIVEDEELPEREFAASEIQTWDDTSAPQRETPQEHTPPHETNKYESESHHSRSSSSSSLRLSPRHEETQQEPIRRSHDEQTHRDADSPRQAAEDAQD